MNRRKFLKAAGGLAAAPFLKGCDSKPAAAAPPAASPGAGPVAHADGPELKEVKFGIIALTDNSPIVIAHEKGFFKKYGIDSVVSKGANWAAIRDSLSNGDIQATHMLTGMPIASTMGLLGSPKKPMIIPWILNRNGQSITVAKQYKGKVAADPKAFKPLVDEAKAKGSPLTFAMTFPPGTHAMWMRYYLAAGGINPDKDVALITVPPPQMVANMKVGKMDGYCVGEPWNARAIADDIGYTSLNTQDIWPDHPEKVCAFLLEFQEKYPKTVKAVLRGLQEASVWLDNLDNRKEQADIVSKPTYINCPPEIILGRMLGDYDFGDGRKKKDPLYMTFNVRNCNYPQPKYVKWFLSQYRRWGLVEGAPDYAGIAKQVMRPDIYEEVMKEMGASHGGLDNKPETLFDGMTFDPAKPEDYAKGFPVHNLKG
ncbi:MAG TPA: CmpA/NrtA family ABC transporter substrate-binding protein [Planctomycetota bacterium]